jgi:arginase
MENHPSVRAVVVPYDSGHRGLRMGARPDHLIDNGLPEVLRYPDRSSLSWMHVLSEAAPPGEVAVAFELDRLVSERVRGAVSEGEFPLVLSGNCNASVGTLAGAGPEGLGIVWFDGHANFNTPERTMSGFLDGMGLAIAVGHCWKAMAEGVPGFRPVAAENVVLVGARDVGRSEEERLDASGVTFVGAERLGREGLGALGAALDDLGTRVGRVYLHLDLDVLDPGKVGPANGSRPRGPGRRRATDGPRHGPRALRGGRGRHRLLRPSIRRGRTGARLGALVREDPHGPRGEPDPVGIAFTVFSRGRPAQERDYKASR